MINLFKMKPKRKLKIVMRSPSFGFCERCKAQFRGTDTTIKLEFEEHACQVKAGVLQRLLGS